MIRQTPDAASSAMPIRAIASMRNRWWNDDGGSLFNRLRLLVAIVFLAGSVLALGAGWLFANAAADEAYDQLLISAAVQIGETLDVRDGEILVTPPEAAFETLGLAKDDRIFYSVWKPDGERLTGYGQLRPKELGRRSDVARTANLTLRGEPVRSVTISRYVSGIGVRGWCDIVVAQTLHARHALAWRLILRTMAIVGLTGILGYVTSVAAIRRALQPLTRIGQALAERQPHDVTPLEVSSPDETKALVDGINTAMARLFERMSKLQQFAAVAAHQLRTPLAALNSQLELLENAPTSNERTLRATRIRHRVNELTRLINQLLGHAMIVYRQELHSIERVDLVQTARAACEDAIPLSLARDLSIGFHVPETPIWVDGDPLGLREALTNVVDNAVTHGARSRIDIRVSRHEETACVTVFDDGPGIAADRWDKVIMPFHPRTEAGSGAGLGLSIVQEVLQRQGGKLTFAQRIQGFEVQICLPLARGAQS